MKSFTQLFKAARRVNTPLIAVRTPDPAATMATLAGVIVNGEIPPLFLWDTVRGLMAANEEAKKALTQIIPNDGEGTPAQKAAMITNAVEMLVLAVKFPKGSIVFALNFHKFLVGEFPAVIQAVWNLRDQFKKNFRQLVMLCPQITLPPEVSQDVLVLDEPLPDAVQLAKIVTDTYTSVPSLAAPSAEVVARAVDATCGLASFSAEQVCAMSITRDGMDLDALWERKRQQIEQTPGLSVWRGGEKFDDVGGCENAKAFLRDIFNGNERPRGIVFIDEIEKAMAGSAGDTTGVTQEMLGTMLTYMQDKKTAGIIKVGPPGTAKSAMAKAAGNEAGIPTISFDMTAMKGSLVGESGANLRAALKIVEAVTQDRALFIATSNAIGNLPPELRRRFSYGTFFYDLPTEKERDLIWKIWSKKLNISDSKRPNDNNWTGAEIEKCCTLSYRLKRSLKDAANYIVPVANSAAEQITKLRNEASGRYISAATAGVYSLRGDEILSPIIPSKRGMAVVN